MPSVIGYLLIASGITTMEEDNSMLKEARMVSYILAIMSLIVSILKLKGIDVGLFESSIAVKVLGWTLSVINFILIFMLTQGMKIYLAYSNNNDIIAEYNYRWRFFAVVFCIVTIVNVFIINYKDALTGYSVLMGFVQLIAYIVFAAILRRTAKTKVIKEDLIVNIRPARREYYILAGVIIICIFTLSWNLIRYSIYRVNEPLFLKQYGEVNFTNNDGQWYGQNCIDIYYFENSIDYFSNKSNGNIIVSFPELESNKTLNYYGYQDSKVQEIFPYVLKTVKISLGSLICKDNKTVEELLKEKVSLTLTEMEVTIGDEKQRVDIGKIVIKEEEDDPWKESTFIEFVHGGSSSDMRQSICYHVLKDMKVNDINGLFLDKFKENREVLINGKSIDEISFPMELKKDSTLEIEIAGPQCCLEFVDTSMIMKAEDHSGMKEDINIRLTYNYCNLTNNMRKYTNLNSFKEE